MTDTLLSSADRELLREFAVSVAVDRPGLLEFGARVGDQLRLLLPSLDDETMAAVTVYAAHVVSCQALATGCPHVHSAAVLLQSAAVDLAHLELDPPYRS